MTTPTHNIEYYVKAFVKLRDKIRKMEEAHIQALMPYREALAQLNAKLLMQLEEEGAESVRTDEGTVHRIVKRSAALNDPASFMKFVIDNQLFDLIERRASVTGVGDYIEENGGTIPPGCNWQLRYEVGVRRPPSSPNSSPGLTTAK